MKNLILKLFLITNTKIMISFFTVFLVKKVEAVTKYLYNMFINIFL